MKLAQRLPSTPRQCSAQTWILCLRLVVANALRRAILFPNLSLIEASGSIQGSKWDRYLELRPQFIDLEASLSEEWLSPELMSALRSENLHGDMTEQRNEIVKQVKAQVVGYLRSGSFSSRRLADIVNYIRLNPESFKEWHKPKTAKLFLAPQVTGRLAPPVFRIEKKASGYFFQWYRAFVQSVIITSQGSFVYHTELELRHIALIFLCKLRSPTHRSLKLPRYFMTIL